MLNFDFVIQSRLQSSRLPFKAALKLPNGMSVLEATVVRCNKIISMLGLKSRVFVACPSREVAIYESLSAGTGAIVFGGDEDSVAQRFYDLSCRYQVDNMLRVTADNPFLCVDVVEYLTKQAGTDSICVSLYHQRKLPNGTVVSTISREYLQLLLANRCPIAQEHLVISDSPEITAQIVNPSIPESLVWPEGRFCLDTRADYLYFYDNKDIETCTTVLQMKALLKPRDDVCGY